MVSPFDAVTQSQLRRIKPRGRWVGPGHGWDFPLAAAGALQQALGRRFPVTSALQQWLDWCQHPLPPLPPLRRRCTSLPSLCTLCWGETPATGEALELLALVLAVGICANTGDGASWPR